MVIKVLLPHVIKCYNRMVSHATNEHHESNSVLLL